MKTSGTRLAPLAISLFVMIVVIALAVANGSINADGISAAVPLISSIALGFILNILPALLVIAAFRAGQANRNLLLVIFIAIMIHAVFLIVDRLLPRPFSSIADPLRTFVTISLLVTDPRFLLSVLVLVAFRYRGSLDWFRYAGLILIAALVAEVAVSFYYDARWLMWVESVVQVACFATLAICAWCTFFRRLAAPNLPPADSARIVSLACPRCHSPQQIPSGGGACTNCRLKIMISLEDSLCAKCRYPLRGLTGEKCPECGTPIVPPVPQAEVIAASPANDQ